MPGHGQYMSGHGSYPPTYILPMSTWVRHKSDICVLTYQRGAKNWSYFFLDKAHISPFSKSDTYSSIARCQGRSGSSGHSDDSGERINSSGSHE